ncbi:MAG TPA: PAS-domain containing protein [Rhizomicrobium sp.]|nr:PAS-domain containing protein [Rhizomicrobium sp.]
MYQIAQIIKFLASPFVAAAHALSPAIAQAAGRGQQDSDFLVAGFVISTLLIGTACVWWAAWSHARLSNFRIAKNTDDSRMRGMVRFRDALLLESDLVAAVLGNELASPISYGGGAELIQACIKGPDAAIFATSLNALLKSGIAFELRARTGDHRRFLARGKPIGRRVVIFFKEIAAVEERAIDFPAILSSVPVPIWVREQQDLSLTWANPAFLDAVHADTLEAARCSNAQIDRSEPDLSAGAREGVEVSNARRYVSVGSERRAISISLNNLGDAGIVGVALDVTSAVRAEGEVAAPAIAFRDMMDRMPHGLAQFGRDRRLTRYNRAYAQLWCLDVDWLDSKPTLSDVLDRLRNAGRLPEQREFNTWKQEQLNLFDDQSLSIDTIWHAPNGKSIKVKGAADHTGTVFFQFEDISDLFRLRGELTLRTEVQRATLETFEDGIAIFGADGRLAMHNANFAKSWSLTDKELSGAPHFTQVAEMCAQRKGRDGIWDIVSAGVISGEPQRYAEWGRAIRADGRIFSLAFSSLPDGGVAVVFKDITDLERFAEELRNKPEIAA